MERQVLSQILRVITKLEEFFSRPIVLHDVRKDKARCHKSRESAWARLFVSSFNGRGLVVPFIGITLKGIIRLSILWSLHIDLVTQFELVQIGAH